jgi:hypothetical protein
VLENDEVVFVVDQLGSSSGFAESGGNLVDAADAKARKDELGMVFTYFGAFPRQGVYEELSSGTLDDGSAWIEARGHELYEAKLAVVTRYTLHPPDRTVLVETALENTGDAPVEIASLGDAIQWGGAEKVAPGKARDFKGPSSGPYIGGVGRYTSYAITSTEGAVDGVSGGSWTDTVQRKGVKLARGQKTDYARVFVVGERPDTSSLVAELTMTAGQAVGSLQVVAPSVPPGASIQLVLEGSTEPLTLAAPFEGVVPPGRYTARMDGGKAVGPVDVKADGQARLELPLEPVATVGVTCLAGAAPMPCKVTLEGTGATSRPDFGPAHVAGPARNQATTATGHVDVSVAPGTYRITGSRGPEYALGQADVQLAPGEHKELVLSIARVVDTAGYLACDFHQHTMLGADAPVGTRDREIANAAEGVEIAVASEHNVVADLEPVVKELHLERELVAIAGDELTTDASRHPWGHANVFPMTADASKPRGGAPAVRDRGAHELFDAIRAAIPGDFVLQINHPRTGPTGYFDQMGLDRARGVGTGAGYDAGFDALEVWTGRFVDSRAKVLDDWRALLRTGHPVTPTADTDTHGIVGQEAGYPRTYVGVADDAHLEGWDAARTVDLVRGIKARRDVVLTNGPMLRVRASGAPVGGLARGRSVRLEVHVECAPWIDVDTVRVLRARDGADSAAEQAKAVTLAATRSGGLAADVVFTVRSDVDDALVVVASGSKPMTPVLGGDPRELLPWAMTGAIWIDADGDGKALGR